jgi:hypothetical protein
MTSFRHNNEGITGVLVGIIGLFKMKCRIE